MRLQALVGIAVAAVSVCAGQAGSTSAPQTPPQAGTSPYMSGTRSLAGPQVMLVGCVTSGATSFDPFTLASPTLVGTVTPGITSSTSATSISLAGGQGTAGTTGTAGTAAGAQGTGAAGSLAGAYPAPSGTTGRLSGGVAASGDAPPNAAAAASTMSDLRLRGTGLSTLAGQRVEVVGTLVPGTGAESSMAPGRELRITNIVPIGGTCP